MDWRLNTVRMYCDIPYHKFADKKFKPPEAYKSTRQYNTRCMSPLKYQSNYLLLGQYFITKIVSVVKAPKNQTNWV